jgi:hypothetical protein
MAWTFHCSVCNPQKSAARLRLIEVWDANKFPFCGPCQVHAQPTDLEVMPAYWFERGRCYGDTLAMIAWLNVEDEAAFVNWPTEVDGLPADYRAAFVQGQAAGEAQTKRGEPMCWEWPFFCPSCHPTKNQRWLADGWSADKFPMCHDCGGRMLPADDAKVPAFWFELGRAAGDEEGVTDELATPPADLPPEGCPNLTAWYDGYLDGLQQALRKQQKLGN